jgi:hypothetical protein
MQLMPVPGLTSDLFNYLKILIKINFNQLCSCFQAELINLTLCNYSGLKKWPKVFELAPGSCYRTSQAIEAY